MSARRYGPRRPLRRELVPLAAGVTLPLALAAVLPLEALSFHPSEGAESSSTCAFVTLTPDQERRALAAARSSWQVGADGVRGHRVDLFAEPLSDDVPDEVVGFADRICPAAAGDVRFATSPMPPSLAAPAPAPIPAAAAPPRKPAFPRDELLTIRDGFPTAPVR